MKAIGRVRHADQIVERHLARYDGRNKELELWIRDDMGEESTRQGGRALEASNHCFLPDDVDLESVQLPQSLATPHIFRDYTVLRSSISLPFIL